ncbi:MAG: aminoglycoside 6-adenylyltransferase [Anaerolineales bacterium]
MVAKTVRQHEANRDALVQTLHELLSNDERVVAAWLTGSLGRQQPDALSDVDLSVVLSEGRSLVEHARGFIMMVAIPVNIHGAPQNAPAGGMLLSVLYEPGIVVDWAFIPEESALRPKNSLLLFERRRIRTGETIEFGKPIPKKLDNRISFFWNLAAVTAKAILRENTEKSEEFLKALASTIEEIIAFLNKPGIRDQNIPFVPATSKQAKELIKLCHQVTRLTGRSQEAFDTILALLQLQNTEI